MFYVSDSRTDSPKSYKTLLQQEIYRLLAYLDIPFERVESDEAIAMEDCIFIEKKLNMKMVKTLFLCNRQQTEFFLFITRGDKAFSSRKFSMALETARVSFAPEEKMEKMLGTGIGAATVFSALLDKENKVKIIIDEEVAAEQWYGCSDGTTTGYIKIKTKLILECFLPAVKHPPVIIKI